MRLRHALTPVAGAALVLAACLAVPAFAQGLTWSGELQTSWRGQTANDAGPLAAAGQLAPGIAARPAGTAVHRGELTAAWQPAGSPYALSGRFALEESHGEHGGHVSYSRVNELAASADWGAWQATVGKKIVSWDVGYAWRPNDVVQQEVRRLLVPITPEGRPVVMLEHFGANSATTLVLVHPERLRDGNDRFKGPEEGALAARGYWRLGALDAHAFARAGEHTGWSMGSAAAWVASDDIELHGSARWLQRHDALVSSAGASTQPLATTPWAVQAQGRAAQWLVGATWTGSHQQSLIAEYWHDGTAPSNAQWDAWSARNAGLWTLAEQVPALRTAVAGNLAWQAEGLGSRSNALTTNLRQDTFYLRGSLQPQLPWPGTWTLAADALVNPADRGRALGASLQWQGDRLRIDVALRRYGGPAGSLYAQLPVRTSTAIAATLGF